MGLQLVITRYRLVLPLLNSVYSARHGVDFYEDMGIVTDGDYLKVADTSGVKDASDNGQWGFNFKYFSENLNDTEFGFYFVQLQLSQSFYRG